MSPTSRLFNTIHGWMCRPRGFFEPKELTVSVISDYNGGRMMVEIEDTPRVVLVTDKLRYEWDPEMPSLEELGYGSYEKDVLMRATYYARRPWVYLLRARVWVQRRLVTLQAWTYRKIWHSHNQEGTKFGWRDIRPGPGRVCQAQAAARGLQEQIMNQYQRIGKLEGERERAYDDGSAFGWESHRKVVEKYIDDLAKPGE